LLQRFAYLALITLALSACSRQAGLFDDSARQQLWLEQQAAASAMTQWNLYARAALRLEGQAYNIGIRWQRDEDGRFTMLLEAPFGQGVMRVDTVGPGLYRLRLPDGRLFEGDSVEALLEQVIGWTLPIGGLDYWVRGLPAPGTASSHRLNADGRAREIRQDGWDILYLDYFEDMDPPILPRLLSLENDELALKLVIERWQQAPAAADDADLFPSFD